MRLLVIDGNSVMNRAYYGIRLLSNHQGIYTNAIYGFMNIYLKHVTELQPDAVAVAFDMRTPTFRHKKVAYYKANRKGMPDELAMQMPYIKKLMEMLGVQVVECEGYEADDVLGTLSAAAEEQGWNCTLLSGDRDILQLISSKTTVRLLTNREAMDYTIQRFREEYTFYPSSMVDYKALMGDTSDNIPGVSGIGQKTATILIHHWETIEKIYQNIDHLGVSKTISQKLVNDQQKAEESKWLATIVKNAPIPLQMEQYFPKPMRTAGIRSLLTELELMKVLDKLHLECAACAEVTADTPQMEIATVERGVYTPDLQAVWAESTEPVCYLRQTMPHALHVFWKNKVYSITEPTEMLRFLSSGTPKATFSAKQDYRYAAANGEALKNMVSDTEIAAYLLNPTAAEYSIVRLCAVYHVTFDVSLGDIAGVVALHALREQMEQKLREADMLSLYQMELQLTEVLAAMEETGILMDRDGVEQFGAYLTQQIDDLQERIFAEVGHPFNIASPKQLGDVLFVEKGLPHGKKTKTGYSTNAEILESLREISPIVDMVLQYRQVTKLRSTYVEGLLKTVGADGRIHSVFKQTETRTGRISSVEPNLQNIPVRTELGRNMRKFFVAAPGNVFVDADYSQIELRVLANLCADETMQAAFLNGTDIHTATAAQVFGMPEEMVTSSMRSAAKAVNFGIIYGIGAFSLSKDIHVSVAEADRYIKQYLERYPKVSAFMTNTIENAKENGYVETYFHRRREIPELRQSNKMVQSAGKRIAMNTPIQGTAADIIKMAMIRVHQRLAAELPAARLLLQVHDELIVEVPEAQAEQAAQILREEMESVVTLAVPLMVEVKVGKSWYDTKD